MNMQTLDASTRDLKGRKTYHLRNEGKIPAVVYGSGLAQPQNIEMDRNAFVRAFKAAGESSLVQLSIDGKDIVNVLIQDIQLDPLRDEVIHADFHAVDMNKPIEAEVSLHFVGESSAVKNFGGTLMKSRDTLAIRALPKDLISSLDVNLEPLKTFDDAIHAKDVTLPEGVELMDESDLTLASVTPPRTEEELATLDSAVDVDVSKIEVEKKGKEDEVEAEGSEAPEAKKE